MVHIEVRALVQARGSARCVSALAASWSECAEGVSPRCIDPDASIQVHRSIKAKPNSDPRRDCFATNSDDHQKIIKVGPEFGGMPCHCVLANLEEKVELQPCRALQVIGAPSCKLRQQQQALGSSVWIEGTLRFSKSGHVNVRVSRSWQAIAGREDQLNEEAPPVLGWPP